MTEGRDRRSVLIVGAGIAGLTAAIALHRIGYAVQVVERSPGHSPVGAGIVLGANAVRCLQALGVDPVPVGRPLATSELRTADDRALQSVPLTGLGPAVSMARSTLHRLLADALPAEVPVRFGESVVAVEPAGGRVRVRTDAAGHPVVDRVVGADGLRSAVRDLVGLEVPLRYSGYTCWRVLVPNPGVEEFVEYWGRGARAGLVPVDGDRVYAYLTRDAPPGDPGPAGVAGLRRAFGDFPAVVDAVLARARDTDVLHHDLSDLTAQRWGAGPVWLVGDAAHAMLPNLGQGAGMGIEDAVALLDAAAVDDPDAGLRRLVSLRWARVERVRRDSRRLGAVGQWSNPWACAVRDRAYAAVPAAVGRRQVNALLRPGFDLAEAALARTAP